MTKWLQRGMVALLMLSVFCAPLLTPHTAHAQFFNDDPDADAVGEPDDDFFDTGTDEFGEPVPGGRDQDVTEGDTYIDESTQPQTITVGGRQVQLKLASERDVWFQNAGWGAGTGLLIGGWFALINSGSNRDTQRAIGLGIVAGGILGAVVGIRYVINPRAPSALGDNSDTPNPGKPTWSPLVSMDDHGTQIGVRLTF
jgi:hypothetical protein